MPKVSFLFQRTRTPTSKPTSKLLSESGSTRPVAVIPANAGIQRRLNEDTGFRVPLRSPGMTVHGRMRKLVDASVNFRFGTELRPFAIVSSSNTAPFHRD